MRFLAHIAKPRHTISIEKAVGVLHYEAYGNGEKTILYLHGWGANGKIFAPVCRSLPDFYNVALDFTGFGESPMPSGAVLTVEDYAEQTAEFLRNLGLSSVTIVAHSFGCRVAMVLSATHPELTERMLLFAPAGIRRFSLKRQCKILLYKVKKRLFPSRVKTSGSADYQATAEALKPTFVKVVNRDLSSYARKIRCKTLIVAAKGDVAVPYKDAKRLNKLIKNSDFVGINGDHFALFYSPVAFAETVRLFMEEPC